VLNLPDNAPDRPLAPDSSHRRSSPESRGLAQHFENILECSTDGFALIGADGKILSWSVGAERIFHYSAEEMVGQGIEILVPPHLRSSGELDEIRRTVEQTGVLRGHRTMRVAKNGSPIVVELGASAIRDSGRRVTGRTEIYRDLTESNRMEHQMRQSQRLATVAQLVTGLAHEIGTPLNVISGRAELMMIELPANHPDRKDLQVIMRESDRVAELIRTLLQFARGVREVRLRRCSINAIVKDVVKLVGRQLTVAGIRIDTDLKPRLPLLTVNRMQIVEVVLNLVVNAWHAMPEGGGISLHTRPVERAAGVWVELRVSDTGKGIPPEDYDRVFNPFFSTKAPGQGTGLGLTVVLSIVQQHGGMIEFTSALDRGSTFIVSLPVKGSETI
jgi:PAS domain S-box-containing protein